MDTRVRITKQIIKDSFLQLLEKQPLNKISVVKVCENAQINRVTFYKHYLDVYDLYDKIIEEFISETAKLMESTFQKYGLERAIESVFKDTAERQNLYAILFSNNVDDTYRNGSLQKCFSAISTIQINIPNLTEEQQAYLRTFLMNGGRGILLEWLQNGMPTSPEYEAERLYKLIDHIIKIPF